MEDITQKLRILFIKKANNKNKICYNTILSLINKNTDENIVLLRKKEVIMWLYNDLSFLNLSYGHTKTKNETINKEIEDRWGKQMLILKRPNVNINKQWTNKFGEYIFEEMMILLTKEVNRPRIIQRLQPDYEDENTVYEIKTGTYFTNGTAHEKILGCPFKYSDIPIIMKKPLNIICIGGSELICRERYFVLDSTRCYSKQKEKFINFYKENGITFHGFTSFFDKLQE